MKMIWVNPRSLIPVSTILVSGCALSLGGYGAAGQSKEEFAHYVEEVFRLQNRMTSEVMMRVDSNEISRPDTLLLAEQRMQKMCDSLNEYVSRDIDGLGTGFFLQRRVGQSATECEHAAREVEALLAGL